MILHALLLSLIAGFSIFIGAMAAAHERIYPKWLEQEVRHAIIAFGGGALIAAVALVLIPEGTRDLSVIMAALTFLGGGLTFMAVDMFLARHQSRASQLLAMMLDFVPEAIVIGAIIVDRFQEAVLMAIIIAAQNMPEAFNAFRELKKAGHKSSKKLLTGFFLVSLTGPLYAGLGAFVFADHPIALGILMTFCAGGIFYLVFQDIAPQSQLKHHWGPSLGAVLGFLVGLTGFMIINS